MVLFLIRYSEASRSGNDYSGKDNLLQFPCHAGPHRAAPRWVRRPEPESRANGSKGLYCGVCRKEWERQ